MRDTSVPRFLIPVDVIHGQSQTTQAKILDQGYTYNQPSLTYNQAGVQYGGLYNVTQDIAPELSLAKDSVPTMTVQQTQALLEDQGYSYNQSGYSYNQLGVAYGGVYNTIQDIFPEVSLAVDRVPRIDIFFDLYTPKPTPTNNRNGPGWFMFVNLT